MKQRTKDRIKKAIKNPFLIIKGINEMIKHKSMNKNLHIKGYEVLSICDKALNESGVKYWLSSGTLLGAYRDKGFIKHDLDMDIAARSQDHSKIVEALTKHGFILKEELFSNDNKIREAYFEYGCIKMDVFYSYLIDGHEEITTFYNEYLKDHFMAITIILPRVNSIIRYKMMNNYYNIPRNTKDYLTAIYGENFMIKNKDWNYTKDIYSAIYHPIDEMYGIRKKH